MLVGQDLSDHDQLRCDPVLAVHPYPAGDYPRPATLASLAAATARQLKAQGRHAVSVGYDTSLYTGPDLALDLVESRTFPKGITTQVYRPAGRPQYAND